MKTRIPQSRVIKQMPKLAAQLGAEILKPQNYSFE